MTPAEHDTSVGVLDAMEAARNFLDADDPDAAALLAAQVSGFLEQCGQLLALAGFAGEILARAIMLGRARDRGEATPTEEQVVDHIIAPLYHHAVFGRQVDQAYADRLVADVLAMAPAGGFTDE